MAGYLYYPKAGESIKAVAKQAAKSSLDVEKILAVNPGVQPKRPLDTNKPIVIPLGQPLSGMSCNPLVHCYPE